jgi:hypothetical protein
MFNWSHLCAPKRLKRFWSLSSCSMSSPWFFLGEGHFTACCCISSTTFVFIIYIKLSSYSILHTSNEFSGTSQMSFGKQLRRSNFCPYIRALRRRISSPSFRSSFTSMAIAISKDYTWRRVDLSLLEQKPTCWLQPLLVLAQLLWHR